MKRHLILAAICFLLACAGLGMTHAAVRPGEQVVLTEHTVSGDPSAADGLTVEVQAGWLNRMIWDTRLTLGGDSETTLIPGNSSLVQWNRDDNGRRWWPSIDPHMDYLRGCWAGGDNSIAEELDPAAPIDRRILRLAETTPAGETRKETLPVSELADSYRFRFYFLDVGLHPSPAPPEEVLGTIEQDFADTFRYPIQPDHTVTIITTRHPNGNLTGYEIAEEENAPSAVLYQQATDEAIYFVPDLLDADDGVLDDRLTPGAGLYRLPHRRETLSIDELERVCPLPSDHETLGLYLLHDDTELVLAVREEQQLVLHILDAATGELKTSFPLWKPGETDWAILLTGDNFLLPLRFDGSFRLYGRGAAGQYAFRFAGTVPDDPEFQPWWDRINFTAAFDGETLALAGERDYAATGDQSCGFALSVYDETGLLYAGLYDSGLDVGEASPTCQLAHNSALRLTWKEEVSP